MLDIFSKKRSKPGLVGVSVSSEKISIAHVISTKGNPELVFCEDYEVPSEEEWEEVLKKQVRAHNLEHTATNFVLSHEDYKLYLVESPKVEKQELAGAIKWKIKDLVDGPVEELAVTLFPVPDDAYRNQKDMVYAVAARKNKIKQVVKLVSGSELDLKSIDIPELVLNNISSRYCDDSKGLAFIDLRSSGSTLNLCREGKIYLTRHLSTSIDHDMVNTKSWDSIEERLVLEIQRSLDYYESQMSQSPIASILIAPRKNDTEFLVKHLNDSMMVGVKGLDLAEAFGETKIPNQQDCIMAIGGALRDGKAAA